MPALITITVDTFVNQIQAALNGTNAFSTASYALQTTPGDGVHFANGSPSADPVIEISKANQLVRFQFSDSIYEPLGIFFMAIGNMARTDPDGLANMASRAIGVGGPNFIQFNAARAVSSNNPNDYKWKFVIAFKNSQTQQLAVLDPEISNVNEVRPPVAKRAARPAKPARKTARRRAR